MGSELRPLRCDWLVFKPVTFGEVSFFQAIPAALCSKGFSSFSFQIADYFWLTYPLAMSSNDQSLVSLINLACFDYDAKLVAAFGEKSWFFLAEPALFEHLLALNLLAVSCKDASSMSNQINCC